MVNFSFKNITLHLLALLHIEKMNTKAGSLLVFILIVRVGDKRVGDELVELFAIRN